MTSPVDCTVNLYINHADAVRIDPQRGTTTSRGAVMTIDRNHALYVTPEVAARIVRDLQAVIDAEFGPEPTAEVLRMPMGRARRPFTPTDGGSAA